LPIARAFAIFARNRYRRDEEMTSAAKTLDAKGLSCPLPVLKARRAMQDLQPGDILEVQVTDPAAPKDFLNFCEVGGHEMIASSEAAGVYTMRIRKAG
jgi:tRNA 2-thiouridine synthesizing protein A